MIRYEVKTVHKSFTGCEPTMIEAENYINSLIDAGVEIIEVNYFNRDTRVKAIREGSV